MTHSRSPSLKLSEHGKSLSAKAGDLVLLRGECGSGKSMWLRRIAGLEPMPAEMQIERNNIGEQGIRMIFDHSPQLWLGQHIQEELCLGLNSTPTEQQMYQALANWHATQINLNAETGRLNKLQALRVNMATVELAAPELLLIDGNTDLLNEHDARHLAENIRDWASRANAIVVVASNRWQDWLPLASRTWTTRSIQLLPAPEEPA